MGSPPWRYRSTVEPLTTTISSLPSLSQSKSPIPPLIDSITYRLSFEEMWLLVRPAGPAMSSKTGTGVEAAACGFTLVSLCERCGAAVFWDCPWTRARVIYVTHNVKKGRTRILARGMGELYKREGRKDWTGDPRLTAHGIDGSLSSGMNPEPWLCHRRFLQMADFSGDFVEFLLRVVA